MMVCQRKEGGRHCRARRNSRAAFTEKRRILRKCFKMHDFLASLQTVKFPLAAAFGATISTLLERIPG